MNFLKKVMRYFKCETINVLLFSYLWTYDLYRPVCNVFDAGESITRAIGRVWKGWAMNVSTFMAQPFQWPE